MQQTSNDANKIPMDTYRKDSTIGRTQKQLKKGKDNIVNFLRENKIDTAFIDIFEKLMKVLEYLSDVFCKMNTTLFSDDKILEIK